MGNKSSSKNNKSNKDEDKDDFDGFFLEDWEILSDKSKLANYSKNKNQLSLNSEILISQVKNDPFQDYEEIKELGSGSFARVFLVRNNVTGLIRAMKVIKKNIPH